MTGDHVPGYRHHPMSPVWVGDTGVLSRAPPQVQSSHLPGTASQGVDCWEVTFKNVNSIILQLLYKLHYPPVNKKIVTDAIEACEVSILSKLEFH